MAFKIGSVMTFGELQIGQEFILVKGCRVRKIRQWYTKLSEILGHNENLSCLNPYQIFEGSTPVKVVKRIAGEVK